MIKTRKKVFVGMSGGVDSSVSALLLKEAGYDVTGVFIKVWSFDWAQDGQLSQCTWRQDRLDAMRVCAKLDIPFITLNLESEYKKEVVDYMIEEYKLGRTPNPDVMCNKYVKFGGFFDWAMEQGADYVATGHYARCARIADNRGLNADHRRKDFNSKLKIEGIRSNPNHYDISNNTIMNLEASLPSKVQSKNQKEKHSNILQNVGMLYELLAGDDKNKDQSYFLWTLTQKQLSKTLFPVGDIEKPEVRRLAEKYGLSTAVKKDSQGLCFIGKIDIKDFLKNYIKEKKGDVLNEEGKIIGEHDGAFYLTIGQRHGFTTSRTDADFTRTDADKKQKKDIKPFYIIAKDIDKNTITVSHSPKLENDESKIARLNNVNWILGEQPDLTKKYLARIRYRQPLEECIIKKISNLRYSVDWDYELHFTNPQKAITAGQSAVIYDVCPNDLSRRGDICLGGGIIED